MPFAPPCSDEELKAAVQALADHGTQVAAAIALGLPRGTFQGRLRTAAQKGLMLSHPPAMPGFEITKVTTESDADGNKVGEFITQKQEHGDVFEMPATHFLGKMTVQRDADGRIVQDWIRAMARCGRARSGNAGGRRCLQG